jgi:hypothetical protein
MGADLYHRPGGLVDTKWGSGKGWNPLALHGAARYCRAVNKKPTSAARKTIQATDREAELRCGKGVIRVAADGTIRMLGMSLAGAPSALNGGRNGSSSKFN